MSGRFAKVSLPGVDGALTIALEGDVSGLSRDELANVLDDSIPTARAQLLIELTKHLYDEDAWSDAIALWLLSPQGPPPQLEDFPRGGTQ